MSLHASLAAGVQALRAGQPAQAVEHLSRVAVAPEWAENPDLMDIHARACSLLAQACLESGQLERAVARPPMVAVSAIDVDLPNIEAEGTCQWNERLTRAPLADERRHH